MFARVPTAYTLGIEGIGVDVEIDVSNQGLPSFSIVGLAEGALKESKERVRSSLKNLGYSIFARPITINLAPADFKKEGSHFDLAIAVGLLCASEIIEQDLNDVLIFGELSLDGKLRGVSGVLSMVEYAKKNGYKRVILPEANKDEALLISDIDIYSFEHIEKVIGYLRGDKHYEPVKQSGYHYNEICNYSCDFSDVKGQFIVRRAVEIAAAGMHNLIMVGSPGSGKTMVARRIPTILPPMSIDEALEVTKVHSVAGLLKDRGKFVTERPFVSPHHTASNVAIIGGGSKAKPGHVSIANRGVLFLDEMLEFGRNVIESLRQPIEDGEVTIARASRTVTYPAHFMLVGAMNPCPCGYYGDKMRECTCTLPMIERYRSKLSGPMLDRIDLNVHVSSVKYDELVKMKPGESSESIRQRVINAQEIQKKRFAGDGICFNSQMSEKLINKYCKLNSKSVKTMENVARKFNLSARSYSKLLKTARTIADLSGADEIAELHILEAAQLKIPDNRGL